MMNVQNTFDPASGKVSNPVDEKKNGVTAANGKKQFKKNFNNVMSTIYHGDIKEYVKSGVSTEKDALALYEMSKGYFAEALLYYIGMDEDAIDETVRADYIEFAGKVLAKTNWKLGKVELDPDGNGTFAVSLYPTNLFEVIDDPLADALDAYHDQHEGEAAMDTECARLCLGVMERVVDQITTTDVPAEQTFPIEGYMLSEDTWNEIDRILTDTE